MNLTDICFRDSVALMISWAVLTSTVLHSSFRIPKWHLSSAASNFCFFSPRAKNWPTFWLWTLRPGARSARRNAAKHFLKWKRWSIEHLVVLAQCTALIRQGLHVAANWITPLRHPPNQRETYLKAHLSTPFQGNVSPAHRPVHKWALTIKNIWQLISVFQFTCISSLPPLIPQRFYHFDFLHLVCATPTLEATFLQWWMVILFCLWWM